MAGMPLGLVSSTFTTPGSSSSLLFVQAASFRPFHGKGKVIVTYASASESATKKRAPRGFSKPRPVSPEMKEFLGGTTEIPRTQLLKLIWAHIKDNGLQDPANKRVIVCDDKLKKIFGNRDQVGFLEIAGLISPHFHKLHN